MTRNEHIQATRDAAKRTVAAMDAIEARFSFPENCCPSCACGPEWHQLYAKLERQLAWLKVLLAKRSRDAGDPPGGADARTIAAINMGAWP